MAGILSADRIIESEKINQKIRSIGDEISKLITTLDKAAESGVKLANSLGGADNLNKLVKANKDITKSTDQLGATQKELLRLQQQVHDLTIKLGVVTSDLNKKRVVSTEILKKENEAIKEEVFGYKAEAEAKKKAVAETKKLNKEIKDQEAALRSLEKQRSAAFVKGNLEKEKEIANEIKLQEAAKRSLEAQRSKAFVSANNKAEAQAQREAAQATKLAAQEEKLKLAVQSQSEGSIRRLQAENQLHAFTIKNKLNPAIASERAEILRLNQVIGTNKDAIADMQRKNVTAWQRVTQAVWQHLAAYVGFTQLIQIIKNVFSLTRELDSLSFSMKTVIKDQKELAQTQQFLADTAQNYGLDLLTISERYIKFRAAALQSNITSRQTMQIFDSMAKAASVLGLKTDEVSGVFLALEQMISKGKVTTEELRRQLGERLPGAFGIMADALGVSLVQLDKMLKAGTILSADALPKFAVALEKAYGIESVDKINTLAAAQGRLKTSWVKFVDEINQNQTFITVINKATDAINDIRYALGFTNELQKYYAGFDKTSLAVQKLTKTFDSFGDVGQNRFKDLNTYQKLWVQSLDASGVSESLALKLFDQYIAKKRILFSEQDKQSKKTVPFDVKGYKQTLDDAQNEFESFNTTNDEDLKEKILQSSSYIKDGVTEIEAYLRNEAKLMKDNSELAYKSYAELEKKKQDILNFNKTASVANEKKFTKEEQAELQARYENYQNYVNARVEIDKLLNKGDKKTRSEDNSKFKLAKEAAEKELAEFKRAEQLKLAEQAKASNELIENDDALKAALEEQKYDSDQRIIDEEIRLQETLLKLTKDGSIERASVESEIAKLKEDREQRSTDRTIELVNDEIAARKKALAQQKKDKDDASKTLLSDTENNIIKEQTILTKKAGEDIKNAKGNARKTKEIKDNLIRDMLNVELIYRKDVGENERLIGDDRKRNADRIVDLQKTNEDQKLQKTEDVENAIFEVRQQTFNKSAELVNVGFDIINQSYKNQLSVAEEVYKSEVAAAGDNLEERIIAERKFENEKKKIARNQAIAQKAQAAFNIALSTAQAIIAIWANPITLLGAPALTAVVAALGAAQLAAALSQPIPAFFKGSDNAPETFIAGDTPDGKGASEMIIKPSGEMLLTPSKATLFSDKSFIGSKILPHDKTNEMLANYAVNQGASVFVDMSGTNKYLNQIAQNTKNNEISGTDSRGRQFIKRGSVTTHY